MSINVYTFTLLPSEDEPQFTFVRSYSYSIGIDTIGSSLGRFSNLSILSSRFPNPFVNKAYKPPASSILTLDTKQVECCLQTALSTTQPIPTCPITMEALTDWSQIMVTSCNHLFEKYALVKWLDKNKGCPMCRTPCDSVGLRRYPLYKQIYCQNDNRVGWVPFINPLTALCLVSRRELGGGGGGGGGKELKSGER